MLALTEEFDIRPLSICMCVSHGQASNPAYSQNGNNSLSITR